MHAKKQAFPGRILSVWRNACLRLVGRREILELFFGQMPLAYYNGFDVHKLFDSVVGHFPAISRFFDASKRKRRDGLRK